MEEEWPRLNGFIAVAEGWNAAGREEKSASIIEISEFAFREIEW